MKKKLIASVCIVIVLVGVLSFYLVSNYGIHQAPPSVKVVFWKSVSITNPITIQNSSKLYFNVTVSVPTSFEHPLGNNTSNNSIYLALQPLVDKYGLDFFNYTNGNTKIIRTAAISLQYVGGGESTWELFATNGINEDSLISLLTADLQNALTNAINDKT